MSPPHVLRKILDYLNSPLNDPPPSDEKPAGDPIIEFFDEHLPGFTFAKDKMVQFMEAAGQSRLLGGTQIFTDKILTKPEIPLTVFLPHFLPLYLVGRKMDLGGRIKDAWDHSGIVQGLRQYWAGREQARVKRMECFQSELGKTIQTLAEEKIKKLITSQNGKIFSMENVQVQLEDGRIRITGTADFPGLDYELELVVKISAKNGKVKGKVEKLQLDGDPIGSTLLGLILDQMRDNGIKVPKNPDLNDLSWIEVPDLARLEVKEGEIVLEYAEC